MLFVGLHQDMAKLQEELRMTMLAGADLETMSPYFFGRFSGAMKERVAALGRGEPIVVEVNRAKVSDGASTDFDQGLSS